MIADEFVTEGKYDPNIFKAVFVVGGPGSGKSTVIDALGLTPTVLGFKQVDFDSIHQRLVHIKKINDYERSDRLLRLARNQWIKEGLAMVIDTTGQDSAKLLETKDLLEEAGYDTMMFFIHSDKNVALDRIARRPSLARSVRDRGRAVDVEYADKVYGLIEQNTLMYAARFGSRFAVIHNARDDYASFEETLQRAEKLLAKFLNNPSTPTAKQKIERMT